MTERVTSLTHSDKRANIPTEELRDFVADDEEHPTTVEYPGLLYARDPSLDPQLVWKGKDEQDRQALSVPAVPIYIQEKIQPQAIIEQVRSDARKGAAAQQLDFFADFNGIAFEDLVDFYQHEQNWTNRLILGDSLQVMTSLAEKEGLKGQVQMIYIDPPYGIKFGSNWQVSTRKRDVKDGKAEDTTRQPEQIKAFRDTWELGIHSYLSYLRDRLTVARELLTESGSVFVQIGDENVHLVRCLMDEVFGSENFVGLVTFSKTSGASSPMAKTLVLAGTTDHILWYAKNQDGIKYRQLFSDKAQNETLPQVFSWIDLPDGSRRVLTAQERAEPANMPPDARVFARADLTSQTPADSISFPVAFQGATYYPGNRGWRTHRDGMARLHRALRLVVSGRSLRYVQYLGDYAVSPISNLWIDTATGSFTEDKVYVVQTATKVIERCLLMTTDPGDLVLDPTCGSGTTAYVAEQWGRRWITIDTSRVAVALARTRLMAARYPYYVLAAEAEAGALGQPRSPDVRKGFVYKSVPHVTLKSIANNEDIDAIHAHWQEQLEPILERLNVLLKQTWREWEVPREPDKGWPAEAGRLLEEWWTARRSRQMEMDDSIARHADTELLYDQPQEDAKRVRVSGPFTVESLSPHRVLSTEDERPASEARGQVETADRFVPMIVENLRKAGVQNTVRDERLRFERLEPYPGTWIHAAGEYTEKDNHGQPVTRRVAVSIGPEHGTVGPQQVKDAAKEAVQGLGFDLLVVCGFAFDPHVSEEAKRYGKLTVLAARMNPDLAMGDELLRKTGAGNLFMVCGEPDLAVKKQKDGSIVVEVRGVDVYDPTTGQVRSSSTDDIACWFIDTDYSGESFFVRHAYFTGADQPYDKLKRALRADIDEAAWSALYTTTSRPFPTPSGGKIAVKVINHYGDEVLKVIQVSA
jgi:adenine-specific DNA-methyltransferase